MTDWLVIYENRRSLSSDNADVPTVVSTADRPAGHYENFPVASWLCPPRLRPAVAALYWFARTADDLADEGDASADARLQDLAAYRTELRACAAGHAPGARWQAVFAPLAAHLASGALQETLLGDLLSAFEQDVRKTRDAQGYASRAELLDYCARSANPVGRSLLHLYGVSDPRALAQSDAVCSALQLINFWQDLGTDIARRRFYLCAEDCRAHGLDPAQASTWADAPGARAAVADVCAWARQLMAQGAPLVHALPGRAGWELRLVIQGGLRVLEKLERSRHDSFRHRPVLSAMDAPTLLWRALWM